MSRRFRHKDGFNDDTDYVEVFEKIDGKTILHRTNGESKDVSLTYPMADCLKFVSEGTWVELKEGE